SADWMPRNLDRRVEVVTPIESVEHQERLQEILDTALADDVLAWELQGNGSWTKVPTVRGIDAQRRMYELALTRARRAPARDGRRVGRGRTRGQARGLARLPPARSRPHRPVGAGRRGVGPPAGCYVLRRQRPADGAGRRHPPSPLG